MSALALLPASVRFLALDISLLLAARFFRRIVLCLVRRLLLDSSSDSEVLELLELSNCSPGRLELSCASRAYSCKHHAPLGDSILPSYRRVPPPTWVSASTAVADVTVLPWARLGVTFLEWAALSPQVSHILAPLPVLASMVK